MEWEYYVHNVDNGSLFTPDNLNAPEVAKMLNWYGSQGWELVSTFSEARHHGATDSVAFVFKRQKGIHSAPPPPVA